MKDRDTALVPFYADSYGEREEKKRPFVSVNVILQRSTASSTSTQSAPLTIHLLKTLRLAILLEANAPIYLHVTPSAEENTNWKWATIEDVSWNAIRTLKSGGRQKRYIYIYMYMEYRYTCNCLASCQYIAIQIYYIAMYMKHLQYAHVSICTYDGGSRLLVSICLCVEFEMIRCR